MYLLSVLLPTPSGVIEADSDPAQPMGNYSKKATEEEVEQASELRAQAASAYGQQKFDEAIALYTKAIELSPGNALFHAKRGQAFLKLKKPNACIRDCDVALELNSDLAAGYKFRGRARRLLGDFELAAHDLRQACKLDFDEETDEWLKEVTPNAKKIEQHRLKQERRQAERKIKERQRDQRRARKEQEKHNASSGGSSGEFSGANPGNGNMSDILGAMSDPEVSAAIQVRDYYFSISNTNAVIISLLFINFRRTFCQIRVTSQSTRRTRRYTTLSRRLCPVEMWVLPLAKRVKRLESRASLSLKRIPPTSSMTVWTKV